MEPYGTSHCARNFTTDPTFTEPSPQTHTNYFSNINFHAKRISTLTSD